MRLFTLLLLCSLFSVGLNAQKLKDEKFKLQHLSLPTSSLPDSMHTYSVDLSKAGSNLTSAGLTQSQYANKLKLTDFKKVPSFGHVQIIISGGRFKLSSKKATKHESKTKDDAGNEKTHVKYTYDLVYTVPVSFIVKDMNGAVLTEKIVGGTAVKHRVGQRSVSRASVGGEYPTAAAATENYKKNAASIKLNAVDKSFNEAVAAGLKAFRAKYDLTIANQALLFEIPSGKKVANATAWQQNATDAAAIATSIRANVALTNEAEKMAGPIKFWETELPKFDPKDKKQRKFYYAAAANLGTAYLVIEDGANAKKYADLLTDELKVKAYEAEQLKKKIAALNTQLELEGYSSRHFPLKDRSLLEGPTPPAAVVAAAAPAPKPKAKPKPVRYDTIPAYVIKQKGGEKIEGTIRLPYGKVMFKRYRSQIKFWDANGEAVSLNPEKVHELGYKNSKLVVYDRPMGTTGLKKRASYLQVDTDAGPMRLLKLVPYYSDQDPIVTEFIEIPEEDKIMALAFTNTRWINWRKSFAELFTDCPVLYAEIRVGYYKNNVRDVRKALEAYRDMSCE
jgi:hypothetical protein